MNICVEYHLTIIISDHCELLMCCFSQIGGCTLVMGKEKRFIKLLDHFLLHSMKLAQLVRKLLKEMTKEMFNTPVKI